MSLQLLYNIRPRQELSEKPTLFLNTDLSSSQDQLLINDAFNDPLTDCSSPESLESLNSSRRTSLTDTESDPELDLELENPYQLLIDQFPDPVDMTRVYELHRRGRNSSKHAELLSTHKIVPDQILAGLVLENMPQESDPRNCITIWGRPPSHVMDLIAVVQQQLTESMDPYLNANATRTFQPTHVPQTWDDLSNRGPLWLMPRDCLHLSILEIVHSAPSHLVATTMHALRPHLAAILAPTSSTSSTLVRPLISFDSSALALTFVPADSSHARGASNKTGYTHYRARLYETVTKTAKVAVQSRYQVPSAHVTIARFVKTVPPQAVEALLDRIGEINAWLDAEFADPRRFEWRIGEQRATECRYGRIWYGGGHSEGYEPVLEGH